MASNDGDTEMEIPSQVHSDQIRDLLRRVDKMEAALLAAMAEISRLSEEISRSRN